MRRKTKFLFCTGLRRGNEKPIFSIRVNLKGKRMPSKAAYNRHNQLSKQREF